MHPTPPAPPPPDDAWRQTHLGRLLGHAMRRFDARVLQLMARNVEVPWPCPTWPHATRWALRTSTHAALVPGGDRLTDLAQRAGMTKQSMAQLVDQCEAWGLVTRGPDPHDARRAACCSPPPGWRGCKGFGMR